MINQLIVGVVGIVAGFSVLAARDALATGFANFHAVKGTTHYKRYLRSSQIFIAIWGVMAISGGITALAKLVFTPLR
jgi:hypothetical protein